MTPDGRRAHDHRARVDLPDWMRNPTPPRRTLGRRVTDLVERLPGLRAARQSLWRWRDRTGLMESHPVITTILSVLVALTGTTALVAGLFYWLHLTLRDVA
ncbi:hypothetical protein ACFHW0_03740 [Micromonospora sp. LOL_025]|uniref:hypothetical protein n=1 Tax=Micromonospora sp. LOL_025 TaxID=3345413 RepID=UPI003A868955